MKVPRRFRVKSVHSFHVVVVGDDNKIVAVFRNANRCESWMQKRKHIRPEDFNLISLNIRKTIRLATLDEIKDFIIEECHLSEVRKLADVFGIVV